MNYLQQKSLALAYILVRLFYLFIYLNYYFYLVGKKWQQLTVVIVMSFTCELKYNKIKYPANIDKSTNDSIL